MVSIMVEEREIQMAVEQGRPLPTTTMQLAGHASSAVVAGLSDTTRSPWMLGIVILNLVGIVAAVYFLNVLILGQQEHLKSLIAEQHQQREVILQMHKQEFDALLELTKTAAQIGFQQFPPPTTQRGPR